jgi:hypothetical protein
MNTNSLQILRPQRVAGRSEKKSILSFLMREDLVPVRGGESIHLSQTAGPQVQIRLFVYSTSASNVLTY